MCEFSCTFDGEEVRTKTCQRVCHCEQSDAKGYDWLIPATTFMSESLEDIVRRASWCQYYQCDDADNEEHHVQHGTNSLKRIEEPSKVEVGKEGQQRDSPHQHRCVPLLRNVVWVVEDNETRNDVRDQGGVRSARANPSEDSDPPYEAVSRVTPFRYTL